MPDATTLADPKTVRSHVPFAPNRIGEGGMWGDLIVEEFTPQPPTEMLTPAESHHQINVSFSREWALREWSGQSRSGIYAEDEVAVIGAGQNVRWAWPYGSAHCVHVHLPPHLVALVADDVDGSAGWSADIQSTLGCQDDLIRRLLRLLYDELRAPSWASKLFVESVTLQLCIALLRRRPSMPETVSRLSGRLPADIARAIDYIDAYLGRSMSLGELAEVCDLSTYQFLRRFKRATGFPPHRFVMQRRAERAAELLRSADDEVSLAALATELGFADQTHFTKVFKRIHGVTPARYRALARSYQRPRLFRQ